MQLQAEGRLAEVAVAGEEASRVSISSGPCAGRTLPGGPGSARRRCAAQRSRAGRAGRGRGPGHRRSPGAPGRRPGARCAGPPAPRARVGEGGEGLVGVGGPGGDGGEAQAEGPGLVPGGLDVLRDPRQRRPLPRKSRRLPPRGSAGRSPPARRRRRAPGPPVRPAGGAPDPIGEAAPRSGGGAAEAEVTRLTPACPSGLPSRARA